MSQANTLVAIKKLGELAATIRDSHKTAISLAEQTRKKGAEAITEALLCGKALNEAKELVPHGQWLKWLTENCSGVDERTAQRYMKLAKNDRLSDLDATSLHHLYIAAGVYEEQAPRRTVAPPPPPAPPVATEPQQEEETPHIKTATEELAEQEDTVAAPKAKPSKPSNGLMYAHMAIGQLEKIQPSDTERGEALLQVISWAEKQLVDRPPCTSTMSQLKKAWRKVSSRNKEAFIEWIGAAMIANYQRWTADRKAKEAA